MKRIIVLLAVLFSPSLLAGQPAQPSEKRCEKQHAQCMKQCDKEKTLWMFKGEKYETCAEKCTARQNACAVMPDEARDGQDQDRHRGHDMDRDKDKDMDRGKDRGERGAADAATGMEDDDEMEMDDEMDGAMEADEAADDAAADEDDATGKDRRGRKGHDDSDD